MTRNTVKYANIKGTVIRVSHYQTITWNFKIRIIMQTTNLSSPVATNYPITIEDNEIFTDNVSSLMT